MGALERYRDFVAAEIPGTHSLEAVREIARPVRETPVDVRPVPTAASLEVEREKTIRVLVGLLIVILVGGFVLVGAIAAAQPPAPSCFALVCGDQSSGR